MDMFDNDLQSMVNYSDETVPAAMPVMEQKAKTKAAEQPEAQKNDVTDAAYTVIPEKRRSQIDRLWDMTKWLGICGGICMLMWWFEMNGLMATEAARPFTFVCGGIGFFGGGMSFKK